MGKDIVEKKTIQDKYVQYILARILKARKNNETTRLVVDIQRGSINSLQDQNIIAGATILSHSLSQI